MPKILRPRSKPRKKGEAAPEAEYNRARALKKIQLQERDASEKRSAQAEALLQPVKNTMLQLEESVPQVPFTGEEYLQAAESLRQDKVLKWHDILTGVEAALTALLGVDLAGPLLRYGWNAIKNKAISPASKIMMNTDNFVFDGPRIKPTKLNTTDSPLIEEGIINPIEILPKKPRLALPKKEITLPEETYTGRIPSRILDLKSIQLKNEAKNTLRDIAQDPNDYTFKEIDLTLQNAFKDEGTVPIEIPSSGETFYLGNNMQEELKKVNAVLERYGYEKIPEGMDDVATRQALLEKAAEHRTFVRGVYLKPPGSRADIAMTKLASKMFNVPEDQVTSEMKLLAAATHTVAGEAENGRQGLSEALKQYHLARRGHPYDAIYTSSRDLVAAGYSVPGYAGGLRGKAYYVLMPVNDTPNASLTLLWENNEFPLMDDSSGKLTFWRTHELPYMLKTGKSFSTALSEESPEFKEVAQKALHDFENTKRYLESHRIKYSDTDETPILKQTFVAPYSHLFRHEGVRPRLFAGAGSVSPDDVESLIARNNIFQLQFTDKPVTPIVERKLGFSTGDPYNPNNSPFPPAYEPTQSELAQKVIPQIESISIKYPRAYSNFSDGLRELSDFAEYSADNDFTAMMGSAFRLKQYGLISDALYKAMKNSLKGEHPDPLKYIDIKSVYKKAKNQYFSSLGKERSADAFARKNYVQKVNENIEKQIEASKANIDKDLRHKVKKLVENENVKIMELAGVKPNYSKKSKDGYRVFTTEGIKGPDPLDESGTHYVVVGPKDTRLLNIKGEYKPNSSRRHHGHSGDRISGISRNLGGFFSPLFLSGAAAYNYYKNDTQ